MKFFNTLLIYCIVGVVYWIPEEAKLNDEKYIAQLADALVRGIEGYFSRNPPLARSRAV